MAVIGIDLGTQSLKAIVVDDELRLRGEASAWSMTAHPHKAATTNDTGWCQSAT